MDDMRVAKDSGGCSLKGIKTYYGIRNSARDADTTTTAKENILPAAGDDGRILVKIVELVFVPISPVLTPEMPGDTNQHGIHDIGSTVKLGFTTFATDIRLMTKADPMDR